MNDADYKKMISEFQKVPLRYDDIAKALLDNATGKNSGEQEDAIVSTKFKENVTLEVTLNGGKRTFKKVTFGVGGNSARDYGRQGFNLKIRGKEDLHGRSQFRLRADARDATFLRSKIACDIHNRLGLVSISASYVNLYVNGDYLGFYVIMDAPKLPWIEQVYGEKDTENLIKCKIGGNYLSEASCATQCVNENDDVTDNSEWVKILRTIDNAKTPADLEKDFEIDHFLHEAAFEYLVGGWDHLLTSGHNYSVYKKKDGKWIVLYYDFDGDFGQDVSQGIEFGKPFVNPNKNYPSYGYEEWFLVPMNIYDVLIKNDPARFEKILAKVVKEAFNPAALFPHIDELKKFIKPEIVRIRTPDENGKLPGVLNELNPVDYSIREWDANVEFTTIYNEEVMGSAYGLKYWILERYRTACKRYNIDCDPKYLDEKYEYPIDKEVEGEIYTHAWDGVDFSILYGPPQQGGDVPPQEGGDVPPQQGDVPPAEEPGNVTEPSKNEPKCVSELVGFPCCPENNKAVYNRDEFGDWGYDFAKGTWCGLTPYTEGTNDESCWSESFGYPCCHSCYVFETDDNGKWGFENNTWCGIQSYCS
ncbi:hypothetical protein BCR32DRAFT_236605 [Anaeromyces robustus]|uniref:CBM10 domain-containing protein n=1 Tax=Anaeromyces robustus TaxID=1754192 RepID=A0A1Y1WSI9_9FUNG|nr:hypothetical protein BCR32DRAFT_236605 [Anaeromyces robustus]|eukprot:ORX76365.1 hypothetical protein BCR32DRAFT_236605 [Anaeromyces robustus]